MRIIPPIMMIAAVGAGIIVLSLEMWTTGIPDKYVAPVAKWIVTLAVVGFVAEAILQFSGYR